MCDRFDDNSSNTNGDGQTSNMIFHRFKKNLIESNYQTKCRKCKKNSGFVLLQKKDVMCGECLIEYCTHKFRSTIGKSHLVKVDDRILLGFSGGFSSIALVDMIQRSLNEDIHRKLRFKPTLFYIDESVLSKKKDNSEIDLTKEQFHFMFQSGIDCYFTTLQSSIEPLSCQRYITITMDKNAFNSYENVKDFFIKSRKSKFAQNFCKHFDNFRTSTSKYDFLLRLKYLIMVKMAKELNFDKIFVCTTMDKLAIGMINNISFGRGMAIRSEMNFCDNRYGSVLLLRPMCELTNKEIAFYLKFKQLDHLTIKQDITCTKFPIKSSIHRLTEYFLTQLSEEFPSTLYTVYKTGNKIISKNSSKDSQQRCKFCLTNLDLEANNGENGLNNYSSFDALRLTSILSTGSDNIKTKDDKLEQYCYSCLILRNEMNMYYNDKDNIDLFKQFCILSNN